VQPDQQRSEIEALKCPQCTGHWLDEDDLKRLEQVVEVKWWEFRHLPPKKVQVQPLDCPFCRPAFRLAKVQSTRDRKVIMDVCSQCHGVWLDGGELEAIEQKGVFSALLDAVKFITK
jgi:Zn-finger nucleic acid-binding protein